MKALIDWLHDRLIFRRRVRVLAQVLGSLIPRGARVLDVGCGDGQISARIISQGDKVTITGLDVLLRPACHIPVREFGGVTIPFSDSTFEIVMLVDVLHHTTHPARLLTEAARVTKKRVLIKDHFREGFLAGKILRLMDWVGNAPKNVVLPYNYLSEPEWIETYRAAGLDTVTIVRKLPLYPVPLSLIFGRSLHFVALLEKKAEGLTIQ